MADLAVFVLALNQCRSLKMERSIQDFVTVSRNHPIEQRTGYSDVQMYLFIA